MGRRKNSPACWQPKFKSEHPWLVYTLFCGSGKPTLSGLLKTSLSPYPLLQERVLFAVGVSWCFFNDSSVSGPHCFAGYIKPNQGIPDESRGLWYWFCRYVVCFSGWIGKYLTWNDFNSKQTPFLCLFSVFWLPLLSAFLTMSCHHFFQFAYM